MKNKQLTITEMIDFAIERGFDVNQGNNQYLHLTRSEHDGKRSDYYWESDSGDYLYDPTIKDLIMNDEFMRCLYGESYSMGDHYMFYCFGHKTLNNLSQAIDTTTSWLLKRLYLVGLNDWDKAHQEMSHYIIKLKEKGVR